MYLFRIYYATLGHSPQYTMPNILINNRPIKRRRKARSGPRALLMPSDPLVREFLAGYNCTAGEVEVEGCSAHEREITVPHLELR